MNSLLFVCDGKNLAALAIKAPGGRLSQFGCSALRWGRTTDSRLQEPGGVREKPMACRELGFFFFFLVIHMGNFHLKWQKGRSSGGPGAQRGVSVSRIRIRIVLVTPGTYFFIQFCLLSVSGPCEETPQNWIRRRTASSFAVRHFGLVPEEKIPVQIRISSSRFYNETPCNKKRSPKNRKRRPRSKSAKTQWLKVQLS